MNKKLFLSIVFVFLLSITNTFSQDGSSENHESSNKEGNSNNQGITTPTPGIAAPCSNTGFVTYSITSWGASCSSGNQSNEGGYQNNENNSNSAACYRNTKFSAAFPSGLTIGCGTKKITLTSAAAVETFLPSRSRGSAKLLSGNLTNPTNSNSNIFAEQLVALTLSVGFDSNDSNFAPNTAKLSSLIIASGTFKGVSVEAFLLIANNVIGGCSTAYTLNDVYRTTSSINSNYINGANKGYLNCTTPNTGKKFVITNDNTVTINNDVSCFGNTNGKATVSVIDGVAPYVYTLDSGATSGSTSNSSYQFTGLGAGDYTVTVTDKDNNTATTVFTITEPDELIATVDSSKNVSCHGGNNGTATASATGGTEQYTYSWSPSGGTAATASGLGAGTYTVTITDAKGCSATKSVIITEPATALTATATPTAVLCKGGNGSVDLNVSGGTSPYSYSWDNEATTEDLTAVLAGTYNVTITDANGCTTTASATVTEPNAALTATATPTAVLCKGGNGSVDLNVSGGTSPYTYSWDNEATTEDLTTVLAGTYNVTITDANGCTTTASATVTEPAADLTASIDSQTNVSCFEGSNGLAVIIPAGGTAPYSITPEQTGLKAGLHTFTITDANSCSTTIDVTITEPTVISATFEQKNVLCNGESNGTATVTANGGTGAYSYSWNTTPTQTTATATGLSAGTYEVTITDANSCSKTFSVTITQPEVLSVSITKTDLICHYDLGTATANVSGGTTPYTYVWKSIEKEHDEDDHEDDHDDHEITSNQTTQTANFKTGTWSVTVTDANGCTATNNVTIILLSYTTVTPAGYSGKSEGNNWAKNYLVANFASKFPTGLTVGGAKTVKFNSAAAIQAFLPSGGAAKALTGNLTDPTSKSYSNALVSQTVALTLTLAFDADPNFSTSIASLGSRVIRTGVFAGKTVNELLALANTVLGGGSSIYKPAQISEALEAINKSYDKNEKHGDEESTNSGYLTSLCTSPNKEKSSESDKNGESELSCLEKSFVLYPNPATDKSNLDFTLKNDSTIKIELYNKYGQYIGKIYDGVAKAGKANSVNINAASLNPDTYLMLIYTNKGVITKRVVVTK